MSSWEISEMQFFIESDQRAILFVFDIGKQAELQ